MYHGFRACGRAKRWANAAESYRALLLPAAGQSFSIIRLRSRLAGYFDSPSLVLVDGLLVARLDDFTFHRMVINVPVWMSGWRRLATEQPAKRGPFQVPEEFLVSLPALVAKIQVQPG